MNRFPFAHTRVAATAGTALLALSVSAAAQPAVVPFDDDHWDLSRATVESHLGRDTLKGTAILKDVTFTNGVIEVDIAAAGRTYPGILFRAQPDDSYERVYVRPHRAGLYPDAIQYCPAFNGVDCWQLYHGAGFTGSTEWPSNQWTRMRIEIHGRQARVFIGGTDTPAMEIPRLIHGEATGGLGLLCPPDGSAHFSNFRWHRDGGLEFGDPPATVIPPGTITEWQLSRSYNPFQIRPDEYPSFFQIFASGWETVASEPPGMLNISRHRPRSGMGSDTVLARFRFYCPAPQTIGLTIAYSDDLRLFFDLDRVYSGRNGYRRRDPSYVGVLTPNDTIYVHADRGLHQVLFTVSESFGGAGVLCRADRALAPVPQREGVLEKSLGNAAGLQGPRIGRL